VHTPKFGATIVSTALYGKFL